MFHVVLLAIVALVGVAELPLDASGWPAESTMRSGDAGRPAHEIGSINNPGRLRYSSRCPLDISPAQPGFLDRCDQPKGCSLALLLHAETHAGVPVSRRDCKSSELGFL